MATKAAPTQAQLETIYRIAIMVVQKFKVDSEKWNDRRPLVIGGILVMATGLIGTMAYYIVTHLIGPLMIYVAVVTVVLAFGLNELSKKLQQVMAEFTSYHTAISKMLAVLLSAGSFDPSDLELTMAAALLSVQDIDPTITDPDTVTYGMMKQDPDFVRAAEFAKMVIGSAGAIDILRRQGLDVQEMIQDVSFAYTDEEYDAFMADASHLLTNLAGYRQEKEEEALLGLHDDTTDDETHQHVTAEDDVPADGYEIPEVPEPEPDSPSETTYHPTDTGEDLNLIV